MPLSIHMSPESAQTWGDEYELPLASRSVTRIEYATVRAVPRKIRRNKVVAGPDIAKDSKIRSLE